MTVSFYGERRLYDIGLIGLLELTVIYADRGDRIYQIISARRSDHMNDDISGNRSMTEPATDWQRVTEMSDAELAASVAADPDLPGTDAAFWQGARVVMPRPKEIVTIRLDADLLAWLRQERGYQTRINAVLRAYMESGARERQFG